MIVVLYLLLGTQPIPNNDVTMNTQVITIVAAIGGVIGLILIIGILLFVLCIMYFKKICYAYKLKGTLSYC